MKKQNITVAILASFLFIFSSFRVDYCKVSSPFYFAPTTVTKTNVQIVDGNTFLLQLLPTLAVGAFTQHLKLK